MPRVRKKEERWSVALDTRRTSRTFSMECEIRGAKEMLSCHWLECLTHFRERVARWKIGRRERDTGEGGRIEGDFDGEV